VIPPLHLKTQHFARTVYFYDSQCKSWSLYKDDQPVFFVTEKSRVLCESGTETLNIVWLNFRIISVIHCFVLIFLQYLRQRRFKCRAFTQHGIQQGESVEVEFKRNVDHPDVFEL